MKIDVNQHMVFGKFHSKLPIETKPEYMTDQFMPYDFRGFDFAKIKIKIQSLSKYVIIPQYSDNFVNLFQKYEHYLILMLQCTGHVHAMSHF